MAFGETVGKGEAFVSASLHAPLAGIVQKMEVTTLANGRHMQAIVIRSEGEQLSGQALWDELFGGKWPQKSYQTMDPAKITAAINDSGIVGSGGAAFPTHVKIMPSDKKPIHTLVVNGCECEPYLTTDYRLMVEAPDAIVAGALLAARAVGARKAYIGIENNKREAVASLRRSAAGAGIKIAVLKTKYPQGSEKHLIKAVLNREVPLGGLPSDIGVAMTNVATVTSVARGVMRGIPLTHRVISVTGGGIVRPKNLLVPIGTPMGALIDYCGGLHKTAARIIAGGQGYADKIELIIGLDPSADTISGLFVLQQKETPGLGNKIIFPHWRNQFIRKKTNTPLVVTKGKSQTPNAIDAVTGATISSRSVTGIVNRTIGDVKGRLTPATIRFHERQL